MTRSRLNKFKTVPVVFAFMVAVLAPPQVQATATSATGKLGFSGYIDCNSTDGGLVCDSGTISVTINGFTKTINYDGLGVDSFCNCNSSAAGTDQAMAEFVASAFNNDSSSPVTASASQDGFLPGWDVTFTTKSTGSGVNYSMSATWSSNYAGQGMYVQDWQWTFTPSSPQTLSIGSPISGTMSGGHN